VGAIVKELFGKEPSRGVNPDEVVAMGAAIQVLHHRLTSSYQSYIMMFRTLNLRNSPSGVLTETFRGHTSRRQLLFPLCQCSVTHICIWL
jgi:molecular chaperone DnaK (HSP70)